jgi:2-iminoacetate synthase
VGNPDNIREVEAAFEAALAGNGLGLEQAERWMGEPPGEFDEALGRCARRIRDAYHGRRILLFAPLYYSNVCVNNCLYCGFRRGNPNAARRVLSPEEIGREAEALLRMGHRRILLVASEDPSPTGRDLLLAAVRKIREVRVDGGRVEQVGMEVAPGDIEMFRSMADVGVDSYTLFQETYNRGIYEVVHPDGPKRDFEWRLGAPDRALRGGIRGVGLGVLVGLGDPVKETIELIRHGQRLEKERGIAPRTISLPRIEPADGSPLSEHPYWKVADEVLLRMIAVIRFALPRTGIVLSSREPAAFRDRALDWGVTEMSAGSRADPGGYTSTGACALAQFELCDHRSPDEVIAMLLRRGYQPQTGGDAAVPPAPMNVNAEGDFVRRSEDERRREAHDV